MSVRESLWSILPLPAIIVGSDDAVAAINGAAEMFLGAGESQIRGKGLERLFGEGCRMADVVRIARVSTATAADHNVEFSWPGRPDDFVDLVAAADEDGEEVLLVIHPRSLAAHIDRSLTHRNAARSITGMASMLGHEIKNPLAGISGAAQLLEMNADGDDQALTTLIREETQRIETLINRFESFGDTGPLTREPVNIHDVLDRARRSAEAGFAAHVRFNEDYDPSLPEIPGDHDQLVQVVLNLLKNAAEATPPVGGSITLRTAYRPGVTMAAPRGARLAQPLLRQISEKGVGIPEDIRTEIFDPFVTSKGSGGGLGLALVSKIVADHGGSIDCVSRPGWTTFSLRFPIWRDAVAPLSQVEV
ncbi:MAG: ATP-binding protein [Pseudomonadota bacterium]